MTPALALILTLALPLAGAGGIALLRRWPNLREGATLLTACALFATVLWLLLHGGTGGAGVTLVQVMPGLALRLAAEPLGLMFATVASGLWIINALFAIGYMRSHGETRQTRFYAFFAIAIASAQGIAFAADMFTLFIFYEALTLSTVPLVAHRQTPEARAGGRTYLAVLLGASISMLLVAVAWTWLLAGTLDFTPGGILAGHIAGLPLAVLLGLYALGIGKAALMPMHRWLPAAMVAPTPVSALLHAVAVVKAGVFALLKVAIYIFGQGLLSGSLGADLLAWLAAFSILAASLIAWSRDNLKARLAYSTVSQLAYVTLGVALATSYSLLGAGLQIAMHAMGKITLFMCAGAIQVVAHETRVSRMDGLGRAMPFTFAAFLVGAVSIVGLPPTGGSWVKWFLILGAADADHQILILVLIASSLMSAVYLIGPAARAFFLPRPQDVGSESGRLEPGAPAGWGRWLMVGPCCLTALGCIVLFFLAGEIAAFLAPILEIPAP